MAQAGPGEVRQDHPGRREHPTEYTEQEEGRGIRNRYLQRDLRGIQGKLIIMMDFLTFVSTKGMNDRERGLRMQAMSTTYQMSSNQVKDKKSLNKSSH